MNTKPIMTITLATTLMLAAGAAMAQDKAMHTDLIPRENIEKGYSIPHRAPIQSPDPKLLQGPLAQYEQHLNALGFSLANQDDVWEANPILDLSELQQQYKANAAPLAPSAASPTAGQFRTMTGGPVYDSVTKSWTVGSKSVLWGQLYFNVTHSATQTMARLQATGRLDGAILNHQGNLFLATADLQAPATGNQSVALNMSAVGYTIWSKSQTGPTVTIGDGKDYTARFFQYGFDWSIAGYGVGAKIWLEGTVGAHYGAYCTPLFAQLGADADASVTLGGYAYADLGIVNANLNARLTLAAVDISTLASTQVVKTKLVIIGRLTEGGNGNETGKITPFGGGLTGGLGFYNYNMVSKRITQADLHLLKGYAKVNVTDPLFGWTIGSWTIWNQPNGLYNWTGVLENYQKTTAIP